MNSIDLEQSNENYSTGKKATYILGGMVYVGVIVIATVLTSMFVTGILPEDAYGLRVLITLGVVAVGLNAFALPVGLHYWAVDGWHRRLAIFFYALDMLILAVNLITAFATLSGNPPAWVLSYAPYSVGMLVFALAAWGILKIVDPGEQANLEIIKAQQTFKVKAIRQAVSFLDSQEGREEVARAASTLIPELFNASELKTAPRSWYAQAGVPLNTGTLREVTPPAAPFPSGRSEGSR